MGQSAQNIKRRIRSVQSTMKITNAMELVATSKLQRQKSRMEKNKEYADYLYDTMAAILSVCDASSNKYLKKKKFHKPLYVIFTADTGLCGGYNSNMFRFLRDHIDPSSEVIMIGQKGVNWLKHQNYHVVAQYVGFDHASPKDTDEIAKKAMAMFLNNEISEINVVFTEFVNSVSFEPQIRTLLPMERPKECAPLDKEVLFEPNPQSILNDLIPMYAKNMMFSLYLRAKTSEHASRRMAMENATDNAQELTDGLLLQYNQARQAAITQEITEIVAGADAL